MSKNVTLLNARAQQISKRVRRHAAGLVDADLSGDKGEGADEGSPTHFGCDVCVEIHVVMVARQFGQRKSREASGRA